MRSYVNLVYAMKGTKTRILQEAIRHVEKFGRKRTRLVAMAEDLGMSHANIYRHFKNKNEILDAIVSEWLNQADNLIEESLASARTPKDAVISIVLVLNAFLVKKLSSETAAVEIFEHAFSDQPQSVAAHLTNLKMRIRENVDAHIASSESDTTDADLLMDVLTTTLEGFLNPLLIHERESANDAEQVRLLIDRLLK